MKWLISMLIKLAFLLKRVFQQEPQFDSPILKPQADPPAKNKCCLHEFTFIGDRETIFTICETCKAVKEAAVESLQNQSEYLSFEIALDELEEAANQIPIDSSTGKIPFHLGGFAHD